MATLTYIGRVEVPAHGGGLLAVARSEAWPVGTQVRLRLARRASTGPDVFDPIADAHSGVPGDNELDGAVVVHPRTPYPDDPSLEAYRRNVRAFSPRIAPGIYYVQVETRTTGAWSLEGVTTTAITVYPVLRFQQVYALRQLYTPKYATGPRTMDEEAPAGA